MGDYFCGTNHILPTGGSARFSSPLGVWDFLKRTSVIHYRREGFLAEAEAAAQFAASEKLTAHENSIRIRLRNE
jgi:histidinol dehydrogenase